MRHVIQGLIPHVDIEEFFFFDQVISKNIYQERSILNGSEDLINSRIHPNLFKHELMPTFDPQVVYKAEHMSRDTIS